MTKGLVSILIVVTIAGCQSATTADKQATPDSALHCSSGLPSRFSTDSSHSAAITKNLDTSYKNMVHIPGGEFLMGASDKEGRPDEYPQHKVQLKDFWMDETEVTNAQFREFVNATGYITTAERRVDWTELQKQLPPGTPKPPDSELEPSSLVFVPPSHAVPLNNAAQWWQWTKGADWKHPQGPHSNINGKDNYPVVQVSWEDATAYAKWANKRLPTEAEWEFAARAGLIDQPYTWGNEPVDKGAAKANIWQGSFPVTNTLQDGYSRAAPARSFAPNAYGLYDMAGNIWEWCADWYNNNYYKECAGKTVQNPVGPSAAYDPDEPTMKKRVVRGGSFLCHASYCASYRVSARMKTSPDTGLEHTGFRCVKD